jgi:predicted flap endonuclease-1-like 5' DNA nuclease
MAKIITIEGIGPTYAAKLEKSGVKSINDLLEKAATPKGRRELSEETGISLALIEEWVSQADFMTIDGIGPQYADLLKAAGVDTVPELSLRDPVAVLDRMVKVNDEKHLVNQLPPVQEISKWIKQALRSPRRIRY